MNCSVGFLDPLHLRLVYVNAPSLTLGFGELVRLRVGHRFLSGPGKLTGPEGPRKLESPPKDEETIDTKLLRTRSRKVAGRRRAQASLGGVASHGAQHPCSLLNQWL